MSTPTASRPVYMMVTQPSLDASTNSVISACTSNRQTHSSALVGTWTLDNERGRLENAGLENAAPDCRGGKRGTGKGRSLKSMESEDFKNVFLTTD